MSHHSCLSLPKLIITLLFFSLLSSFFIPQSYAEGVGSLDKETIKVKLDGFSTEVVADELIIKYKDDATWAEKKEFKEENNLEKERVNRDALKKVDIEKVVLEEKITATEIKDVIEELESNPVVEYVEPNYVMNIQTVPNDADYSKQWALPKMDLPAVWDGNRGNENVVIAILDTGLDYNHPDKPVRTALGYDFVNDDNSPQDDHGHGTYIAGVIAARSNNNAGIAGICWRCTVMPIKVMNQNGVGTYADVANGIVWAADHGADIINLSIGGYAVSQTLQDAVIYAQNKGVLIVAAAGNQGVNSPLYPASFPNVIGVSATDENDERWARSNSGSYVDVSAPGVGVYGLGLNGQYRSQTGTSVAAAHVSGLAALFLSGEMGLSNNQLSQKLYNNAVDLGASGKDSLYGYGRVSSGIAEDEEGGGDDGDSEDPGAGIEDDTQICDEEGVNQNDSDCEGILPPSHVDDCEDDIDCKNNENQKLHDLAIMNIEVGPMTFEVGEPINIIAYIQNQGESKEENIKVKFFVNNIHI